LRPQVVPVASSLDRRLVVPRPLVSAPSKAVVALAVLPVQRTSEGAAAAVLASQVVLVGVVASVPQQVQSAAVVVAVRPVVVGLAVAMAPTPLVAMVDKT
jgi:hypothetical protein